VHPNINTFSQPIIALALEDSTTFSDDLSAIQQFKIIAD
jgi:hypothetical protein